MKKRLSNILIAFFLALLLVTTGARARADTPPTTADNSSPAPTTQVNTPATPSPGGHDASADITNVELENPDELRDGSIAHLHVDFDEHSHKIHHGDYITVKWPSNGQAFAQGYHRDLHLTVNGNGQSFANGADLAIEGDHATITFENEQLDSLEHVKGWAEFDVQVRNAGSNDQPVTITVGPKTLTLPVKGSQPSSGETDGAFYDKRGDMQPTDINHLRWFLCVNNHHKPVVGTVTITDTPGAGHQLDRNSFRVQLFNQNTISWQQFQQYYPSASLHFNDDGSFQIELPERAVSNYQLTIWYTSTVTNPDQEAFANNSRASYQIAGHDPVKDYASNKTIKNVNIDGGVAGDGKHHQPVTPHGDGGETPVKPKEIIPWTELKPATKTIPWKPLTPAHRTTRGNR